MIDEKAFEFAKKQWHPNHIREFVECYENAKQSNKHSDTETHKNDKNLVQVNPIAVFEKNEVRIISSDISYEKQPPQNREKNDNS